MDIRLYYSHIRENSLVKSAHGAGKESELEINIGGKGKKIVYKSSKILYCV